MIKNTLISIAILLFGSSSLAVMNTSTAAAGCGDGPLLIVPWYRGLTVSDSDCSLKPINDSGDGVTLTAFIWTVVLNIIQAALVIVGYVAVGYVIKGGISYMTATGDPGKMSSAKRTITNALVGLAIALASAAIVNLVTGAF